MEVEFDRRKLFLKAYSLLETEQESDLTMPYCPECGGEMQYMIATKHYVCKSCGLSVTQQELIELREKLRPKFETEEDEQEKRKKEYLKWWLTKKK
jgi:tRNA(Ile2) C34 agmatinyltransferase TiaS